MLGFRILIPLHLKVYNRQSIKTSLELPPACLKKIMCTLENTFADHKCL